MLYSDISGELVELADQIGSGREGGVYRIIGSRGIAKIYHDPTPELAGKVEVMARAVPLLLRLKEEMMMHVGRQSLFTSTPIKRASWALKCEPPPRVPFRSTLSSNFPQTRRHRCSPCNRRSRYSWISVI